MAHTRLMAHAHPHMKRNISIRHHILTEEVSTVRIVAAQLSPYVLKNVVAPIVRTPGDVTSRQES